MELCERFFNPQIRRGIGNLCLSSWICASGVGHSLNDLRRMIPESSVELLAEESFPMFSETNSYMYMYATFPPPRP
jgi:hypothetical protein